MNLKDPRINRIIGYAATFSGFFVFGLGRFLVELKDPPAAGHILCAVAIIILVAAFVWMIKKVRCPHCGALLHLKLYPIKTCPYCGNRTDDVT